MLEKYIVCYACGATTAKLQRKTIDAKNFYTAYVVMYKLIT